MTRNRIVTVGGGYGIFLNSCIGNILYPGLVANNVVTITGSNYNYGIYLSGTNYLNVYYNSVLVNVPSVSGIALYVPSGNNIRLANNVFANTGGGYVYYVNTPSGIESSHRNNLYGNGTFIGYIGSSYITDLPALRIVAPYRILYRQVGETVVVVAISHGARKDPFRNIPGFALTPLGTHLPSVLSGGPRPCVTESSSRSDSSRYRPSRSRRRKSPAARSSRFRRAPP